MKTRQSVSKKQLIDKRVPKIRRKLRNSAVFTRLCIRKSNKLLSAQVIDDKKNITLFSVRAGGKNTADARELGKEIARRLVKKKIGKLLFDRSGYKYHGVIKAIADTIREGGIKI